MKRFAKMIKWRKMPIIYAVLLRKKKQGEFKHFRTVFIVVELPS